MRSRMATPIRYDTNADTGTHAAGTDPDTDARIQPNGRAFLASSTKPLNKIGLQRRGADLGISAAFIANPIPVLGCAIAGQTFAATNLVSCPINRMTDFCAILKLAGPGRYRNAQLSIVQAEPLPIGIATRVCSLGRCHCRATG